MVLEIEQWLKALMLNFKFYVLCGFGFTRRAKSELVKRFNQ